MKEFAARLKKAARTIFIVLCVIPFCCVISACGSNENGSNKKSLYGGGDFTDAFEVYSGFSVNYLDVGNGDAIFINFGDGKTMLIDCGAESDLNLKTIKRYLDAYAKNGLDYLVLTHPDSDHVGNAAAILNDYKVGKAYIPYLLQPENFAAYYGAYSLLTEKEDANETKIIYSTVGKMVYGEDYYLIMLSPNAKNTTDSAYDTVNSSVSPSPDAINNLSPIIYLDYKGVRFIFTGDAGVSQERVALTNVDEGLVDRYLNAKQKAPVNLTDIDFLKVSHHGSDDGSGREFLQRITPKNAVISVSGNNGYGFPKQETLTRILDANGNCKFYITGVKGTVSVLVDGQGNATVKTSSGT